MKTYIFIGDGDGIPGLAHEITDEQAKAQGVELLLTDAVERGVYVEKQAVNEKPAKTKKENVNG